MVWSGPLNRKFQRDPRGTGSLPRQVSHPSNPKIKIKSLRSHDRRRGGFESELGMIYNSVLRMKLVYCHDETVIGSYQKVQIIHCFKGRNLSNTTIIERSK